MDSNEYNLRSKKTVASEKTSFSSDDIEFFDTTNLAMSEMDNILTQMRELQREVNSLREQRDHTNELARSNIQKVHIPKFNKHNPHLWFAQVERSFALCDVTSDNDKFDFVSVRLEDDVLLSVEDLITNPPANDKFKVLRERLISKFAESPESKLRRLLQGGETVGMKPSEVLAHMKRLAPGIGNEAIIRTLFIGQMPESIRPLLSIWEQDDLDKLAKTADKMLEANTNSVSAISHSSSYSETQLSVNAINPTMAELTQAIKILSDKIDNMKMQSDQNNGRRSRSKSRSRSQSGQKSSEPQLCWYHGKFGNNAKRCKPNCPRYDNSNSEN